MNLRCTMFLLAVEEMNFTKAASKAFVTQQCLSSHIKKLEDEYDVKLFERKPTLHLTHAGESFYYSLRQIQLAEASMDKTLNEIKTGMRGEIIFGINATRAQVLLPDLFTEYHKLFPLVNISIILDDMKNLVPKLLDGKIDILLGIDCVSNSAFNVLPLKHDEVCLVATNEILEKYAQTPNIYKQTITSGEINLLNFPGIPFTSNYKGSSFNRLVKKYLNSYNITQKIMFSVSDYNVQLSLCIHGQLVAFCPKSVLVKVVDLNNKTQHNNQLHSFKLFGLTDSLRVELITLKNSYQPYFLREFITLLKKHIDK